MTTKTTMKRLVRIAKQINPTYTQRQAERLAKRVAKSLEARRAAR